MKVIKPRVLAATDITSINIAVPSDPAEYAAGTTYATGTEARVSDIFPAKIYKSLIDDNVGNYPPDNITKWSDQGAINKDAMFDNVIGTQSTSDTAATSETASSITFTLNASKCNAISLFNLECTSVEFTVKNSTGTTQASATFDLPPHLVANLYQYFYSDWVFTHDIIWSFPALIVGTIEVKIYHNITDEYAKCGNVLFGSYLELGKTQYGISTSIMDFSKKERNVFGNTYIKQGNFAKIMNLDIILKNENYDIVQNALTSTRGIPTLFSGNNETDYEAFNVLGFFKDFNLVMRYPTHSECSINVEGLV